MNMNEYKGIPGWFNFETVYDRAIREAPDGAHFVEVGSFLGASLAYLAEAVARSGKKIKITAIDIWNEKFWDTEPKKNSEQWLNGKSPFVVTTNHLKRLGLLDKVNLIQGDSIEVSKLLHDDLFFVFLDTNHSYERVKSEIKAYLPKIVEGGILAGHDYMDPGCPGVRQAVNDWFSPTHEIIGDSWWIRNTDDGIGTTSNILIPKVFHQIWIGEGSMPDQFIKWAHSWLEFNPGWKIKLWDEDNFETKYPEILARCTTPQQKSNILRYEIMLKEGGFYIDTDFQCLRPIDRLISNLSCVTFAQLDDALQPDAICSGAFGATPNHPLVRDLLEEMSIQDPAVKGSMGPSMFTRVARRHSEVTIIPQKRMFPYSWNQPELAKSNWTKDFPEAYAVHHWASVLPVT